jgi:hypothetical protein
MVSFCQTKFSIGIGGAGALSCVRDDFLGVQFGPARPGKAVTRYN